MSMLSEFVAGSSDNLCLDDETEMHIFCPTQGIGVPSAQNATYGDFDSKFMCNNDMDDCALQESNDSCSVFGPPRAILGLEQSNDEYHRCSETIWSRSPRRGATEDSCMACGVSLEDIVDCSEKSFSDDTCIHMDDALDSPPVSLSVNSEREPLESQNTVSTHLLTDASVCRTPDTATVVTHEVKRAAVLGVGGGVVQYRPSCICCGGKPCVGDKQILRMHKNRESAQKSRVIKAEKSKALDRELLQFKSECAALREENYALKAENELLRAGALEPYLRTNTTPSPSNVC